MVLSGIQLNSFTNAAFNDVETIPFTLRASWDVEEETPNGWASLEFISIKGDCNEIIAILKNGKDSKAMPEERKYEVWWAKTGNDLNNNKGELVGSGTFNLGTDEKIELSHSPKKSGNYRFIAYQEEGKPGQPITRIDIEIELTNCEERGNPPKGKGPKTKSEELSESLDLVEETIKNEDKQVEKEVNEEPNVSTIESNKETEVTSSKIIESEEESVENNIESEDKNLEIKNTVGD
ncbi:hypothetical protein [Anaerobacillus alkaliphilus]|uniref:hypothetical protein n=1 Tax=Anaerobacillus alkaliphilus TaxID=1548597 RepID=UPI00100AA938|nr:hypothetical protein [Anaerobacillus alkaliphilus]